MPVTYIIAIPFAWEAMHQHHLDGVDLAVAPAQIAVAKQERPVAGSVIDFFQKRGISALFHTTQTSQKLFDFTKVKAKNFTAFLLKVKLTYSVSSNSTLPHHLQETPLLQRGFL